MPGVIPSFPARLCSLPAPLGGAGSVQCQTAEHWAKRQLPASSPPAPIFLPLQLVPVLPVSPLHLLGPRLSPHFLSLPLLPMPFPANFRPFSRFSISLSFFFFCPLFPSLLYSLCPPLPFFSHCAPSLSLLTSPSSLSPRPLSLILHERVLPLLHGHTPDASNLGLTCGEQGLG